MIVIRLIGLASGWPTPFDREYLKEYDPSRDGEDPWGFSMLSHIVTTPYVSEAKQYTSVAEARAEMMRVDERNPTRSDGYPNRPLTAFTVEMFNPKRVQP